MREVTICRDCDYIVRNSDALGKAFGKLFELRKEEPFCLNFSVITPQTISLYCIEDEEECGCTFGSCEEDQI